MFSASRRPSVHFRAAVVALALLAPLSGSAAQTDTEIVSNETVMHMVAGKLSKDLIIGKINAAIPGYDLSSEGLVQLATAKVDDKIVKAMFDVAEAAKRRGVSNSVTGVDEVLTNEIIIRMVTAKIGKDLIMRKMQTSRSQYDVSSAGMVNLNQNKVSQDIIKTMMMPPRPPEAAPSNAKPADAPKTTAKTTTKPASTTKAAAKTDTSKAAAKPAAKTPPPPVKKPPQH